VWEITAVRLLCRRADPIIGTICAKICQPQKVFRRDTLFTINQKMKKNRPQTQHLMVIGVAVVVLGKSRSGFDKSNPRRQNPGFQNPIPVG
jgi:hypothetical protein